MIKKILFIPILFLASVGFAETFGLDDTPTYADYDNLSGNWNAGSKFSLGTYADVTKISAYMATSVSTANVKACIWDDDGSGGIPSTILASSYSVEVSTAVGWYDFTIACSLSPGDYILGVVPDDDCKIYQNLGAGYTYFGYSNNYTTPTTFDVDTSTSGLIYNIYATYTPTGGGSGPTIPTGFNVTALSTGSINIEWTDVDDEDSYLVYNSTTPTLLDTLAENVTYYIDSPLLPNTSYSYFVVSSSDSVCSDSSTIEACYTLAESPYNLSATSVYFTSATLNFSSTTATSYNIYASTSSDFTVGVTTFSTILATPTITGLAYYTTYYIRILGLNGDSVGTTSYTNIVTTRTMQGGSTTFGLDDTPTYADYDNLSGNWNAGSKFSLGTYADVTKISAYMATSVSTANVKACIWDDDGSGGIPSTILASSYSVEVSTAVGWYDFTIACSLSPGDYILGVVPDDDCKIYQNLGAGYTYFGYSNNYTTPTTFDVDTSTSELICNIYATYSTSDITYTTTISTHLAVTVLGTSGEVQKCIDWDYPVTWQHIAITWDDSESTLKLYVNGVLQTTSDITGVINTGKTDGRIYIGAQSSTENFAFGTYDEVGVFKRILTVTEINEIINSGLRGNEPSSGSVDANSNILLLGD